MSGYAHLGDGGGYRHSGTQAHAHTHTHNEGTGLPHRVGGQSVREEQREDDDARDMADGGVRRGLAHRDDYLPAKQVGIQNWRGGGSDDEEGDAAHGAPCRGGGKHGRLRRLKKRVEERGWSAASGESAQDIRY